MPVRTPRFGAWVLVAGLGAALLAGCGAGGTAGPAAATGAFPVTVRHGQGEAVIPRAPERVVVLGSGDAQIATALGAPVVGAVRNPVRDDGAWLGESPPLPAAVRTLDPVTPNLEAIAALRPDLILMTTSQPSYSAVYAEVARIAPTVSFESALLQDSGDDLALMIGRALGREDAARDLVARSGEAVTRFAAEHPGLAGRTYAWGQFAAGTTYLVTAPDSPSAEFFDRLGMVRPASHDALPPWQAGMVQVPAERLTLLDDADVVILGTAQPADRDALLAEPLVQRSRVLAQGRLHVVDAEVAALLLTPNPASVPALLDTLRPLLEES